MNSNQYEMLLNQLFDCSSAIQKAIETDDFVELDNLIKIKNEKIELIDLNKKFFQKTPQVIEKINKIKAQDACNLELIINKKQAIQKKVQNNMANLKILKVYEQVQENNGSIVDINE